MITFCCQTNFFSPSLLQKCKTLTIYAAFLRKKKNQNRKSNHLPNLRILIFLNFSLVEFKFYYGKAFFHLASMIHDLREVV